MNLEVYDDNRKYLTIQVSWGSSDSWTELTLHNKSKKEALEDAILFGFKEPKWWQFWKAKKPKMECW